MRCQRERVLDQLKWGQEFSLGFFDARAFDFPSPPGEQLSSDLLYWISHPVHTPQMKSVQAVPTVSVGFELQD